LPTTQRHFLGQINNSSEIFDFLGEGVDRLVIRGRVFDIPGYCAAVTSRRTHHIVVGVNELLFRSCMPGWFGLYVWNTITQNTVEVLAVYIYICVCHAAQVLQFEMKSDRVRF